MSNDWFPYSKMRKGSLQQLEQYRIPLTSASFQFWTQNHRNLSRSFFAATDIFRTITYWSQRLILFPPAIRFFIPLFTVLNTYQGDEFNEITKHMKDTTRSLLRHLDTSQSAQQKLNQLKLNKHESVGQIESQLQQLVRMLFDRLKVSVEEERSRQDHLSLIICREQKVGALSINHLCMLTVIDVDRSVHPLWKLLTTQKRQ